MSNAAGPPDCSGPEPVAEAGGGEGCAELCNQEGQMFARASVDDAA